jgi:hypothetical protein
VLPHFNFQAMTASAVGRNWDKATPEQKTRLNEEFRTMLVRTYSSAIAAYSNQKFDFRPLRAKPTDTDVTVNVRVLQSGTQPVTIDYDMEKRPSGWKVWDVRVAGISLVANYRTEFDTLVRDSGIDGLLKAPAGEKPLARAGPARARSQHRSGEEMIRRDGEIMRVSGCAHARQRRRRAGAGQGRDRRRRAQRRPRGGRRARFLRAALLLAWLREAKRLGRALRSPIFRRA